MASELLPLLAPLLARAAQEGLKVKVSDEREGVLIEAEQEGIAWLVGEDGTVYCDECGWRVLDENGGAMYCHCERDASDY